MSERETRDFMSVDSFSQLPFIRPAPADRDKTSSSAAAIRLFGIEVPHDPDAHQDPSSKETTATTDSSSGANSTTASAGGAGESGRKFECHYCCRNFPTSQALGGHQNAHKRERQHAKRAHLQSAMAAHHHHSAAAAAMADGRHMYGLLNYNRLCPVPQAAGRFAFEPSPPSHYPSWSSTSSTAVAGGNTGGARFYGGLGSVSQPINGSPLPGLWRVPSPTGMRGGVDVTSINPNRDMPLPLFSGTESSRVGGGGGGGLIANFASSSSTSQNRVLCETRPSVKDNVSLDLHL